MDGVQGAVFPEQPAGCETVAEHLISDNTTVIAGGGCRGAAASKLNATGFHTKCSARAAIA